MHQARLDEALPDALLAILENPERAANMGAAGRSKAQAQMWTQVTEQLLAVYQAAP